MTISPSLGSPHQAVEVDRRRRGSALAAKSKRSVLPLAVILVLVALWQIATDLYDSPFFPPPFEIAKEGRSILFTSDASSLFVTEVVRVDVADTMKRMLLGFALAVVIGIGLGMILGRMRILRELLEPTIEFLRSIPAAATLPLFILLIGIEDQMRVLFIAWGSLWYVLINTISGTLAIHPVVSDMSNAFRVSQVKQFFRIILPAALPKIFAGLRISLTAALILTVLSELFGATSGIGYQLTFSQSLFQLTDMWVWMVLLALIGFILNSILEYFESLFLAWHRASH